VHTPFERAWQGKGEFECFWPSLRVQTFNILAPCLAQGSTVARNCSETSPEEHPRAASKQKRNYGVYARSRAPQCREAQSHNFQCNQAFLAWEHRFPRLRTELLQYQPDLLCLQELDATAWTDVRRLLRESGYSDGICSIAKGGANNFVGMFWKLDRLAAIGDHEIIYLKAQGTVTAVIQRLCLVSAAVSGDRSTSFLAVTAHFKAGLKEKNEQDRARQASDLLVVLEMLAKAEENIILTGDFNSHIEPLSFFAPPDCRDGQPQEPLPSLVLPCLESKGFRCAVRETTGRAMSFSQWCMRGDVEIKSAIDHILLRGSSLHAQAALAAPEDAAVIAQGCLPSEAYPSDHMPVVVDIAFREANLSHVMRGYLPTGLQAAQQALSEKELLEIGKELPQEGRVAITEDGFKYVALPKDWQAFCERLCEAAASCYKCSSPEMLHSDRTALEKHLLRKLDTSSEGMSKYHWGFWTPQSPAGLHITLGKHADALNVGKRVRFQVRKLLHFQSRKLGEQSSFEWRFFGARWFTFQVNLVDSVRCEGDEPHISFACFGAKLLQ